MEIVTFELLKYIAAMLHLPKMIGLLIFVQTMNELVKVCSFIVKSNIVIPFASMS